VKLGAAPWQQKTLSVANNNRDPRTESPRKSVRDSKKAVILEMFNPESGFLKYEILNQVQDDEQTCEAAINHCFFIVGAEHVLPFVVNLICYWSSYPLGFSGSRFSIVKNNLQPQSASGFYCVYKPPGRSPALQSRCENTLTGVEIESILPFCSNTTST